MYEDVQTPPSLKRDGKRKKDQNKCGEKKPGQKKGHKGVTRPPAKPDRQVEVTKDRCPDCGTELGDPFSVETKVIEEIFGTTTCYRHRIQNCTLHMSALPERSRCNRSGLSKGRHIR